MVGGARVLNRKPPLLPSHIPVHHSPSSSLTPSLCTPSWRPHKRGPGWDYQWAPHLQRGFVPPIFPLPGERGERLRKKKERAESKETSIPRDEKEQLLPKILHNFLGWFMDPGIPRGSGVVLFFFYHQYLNLSILKITKKKRLKILMTLQYIPGQPSTCHSLNSNQLKPLSHTASKSLSLNTRTHSLKFISKH